MNTRNRSRPASSPAIWTRLLTAPALAMRPARLGISLVAIIIIALFTRIPTIWLDDDSGPGAMAERLGSAAAGSVTEGVLSLDHMMVLEGLRGLLYSTPVAMVRAYPWESLLLIPLILAVWAVAGGAISRSAATEHATHTRLAWTRALGFSCSRWFSFIGAKIGPLFLCAITLVVLAGLGWLLLKFPFVQVIGAVLFVIALVVSAGVCLALIAYTVGMPMLVPAVACEGTDAIDATQRVSAYVIAKPATLAWYLIVLLVQAVVVTVLLGALAGAINWIAAEAVTWWIGGDTGQVLRDAASTGADPISGSSGSLKTTARILGFWSAIPALLVSAFVVSYWFSGGTVLYLCMRQACDGQDPEELWQPGLPTGTSAAPVVEDDSDEE